MIEYPVRREDIRELGRLEETMTALANGTMEVDIAISTIGTLLFSDAVRLSLDEDVVNLCEFSKRVGYEMLSADFRASYFNDNCWTLRPRDSIDLKFTHQGDNSRYRVLATVDVRNVAMVLHFALPLGWEPRWKLAGQLLNDFISTNNLWSYGDTERVAHSGILHNRNAS